MFLKTRLSFPAGPVSIDATTTEFLVSQKAQIAFQLSIQYIVPYELSAEFIIIKLSAYSIRDDNRKIPIDCGKCHVKHDVTFLLT